MKDERGSRLDVDGDAALAGLRDPEAGAPQGTGRERVPPLRVGRDDPPAPDGLDMPGVKGPVRELGIGADLDLDQLVRVLARRGLAG